MDTISTLLAKLESILHTFPEIQMMRSSTIHSIKPMSFLALNNANNTLTCSQMLHASDKQEFLNSESDEINGLLIMNTWKYQRISCLPSGTQLINSIWPYHHKCTVDGHLLKYKVHLCTDGQQQQYGVLNNLLTV